eukprot:m.139206 g.139206  ORF g.139206 m.139206 type:complete len:340 (-) comp14934_c4_seq7:56-1075(-)
MAVHIKARSSPYQGGPERFPVPDSKVDWKVKFIEYAPVEYTAPSVKAQPVWADNPAEIRSLKFNALDGKINRKSHEGEYVLESATGLPLNPHGRTGMTGRGLLGRFGPNHAADPIVTRWKRQDGQEVRDSRGNKVLEFVGIKRKDTGEWALPGGMVDAGENVSLTLKREFGEEALNTLELSPSDRKLALHQIEQLFASGVEMYKGYVDDPRNTDNAWMETVAMNFHDETGELTQRFTLCAGDDAGAVKWIAATPDLRLYASHADFIRRLVDLHRPKGVGAGAVAAAPASKTADESDQRRQRTPKRHASDAAGDGPQGHESAVKRHSPRIAARAQESKSK